jgi:hypothetical protein
MLHHFLCEKTCYKPMQKSYFATFFVSIVLGFYFQSKAFSLDSSSSQPLPESVQDRVLAEAKKQWPQECPDWIKRYEAIHNKNLHEGMKLHGRFLMHQCSTHTAIFW